MGTVPMSGRYPCRVFATCSNLFGYFLIFFSTFEQDVLIFPDVLIFGMEWRSRALDANAFALLAFVGNALDH